MFLTILVHRRRESNVRRRTQVNKSSIVETTRQRDERETIPTPNLPSHNPSWLELIIYPLEGTPRSVPVLNSTVTILILVLPRRRRRWFTLQTPLLRLPRRKHNQQPRDLKSHSDIIPYPTNVTVCYPRSTQLRSNRGKINKTSYRVKDLRLRMLKVRFTLPLSLSYYDGTERL